MDPAHLAAYEEVRNLSVTPRRGRACDYALGSDDESAWRHLSPPVVPLIPYIPTYIKTAFVFAATLYFLQLLANFFTPSSKV